MGRSQRKWEEIYHQMNSEKNLIEQNDESRFLLFISFGEAKNLPLIPSSSSGHPIECWIRIRLCDADGTPLHDEEAIDSKYIPYSENPNFGMIPMMIGDSHHINASLDTLEDTFLRVEFVYGRRNDENDSMENTIVGFDEISLFILSPMGDPLHTTLKFKSLRVDGSKRDVGEITTKIKLMRTSLDFERLVQCRSAFEIFDLNGNGTIEATELKNVLEHLNLPCTDSQVLTMISHIDENNTKAIEIHEFLGLMDGVSTVDDFDSVLDNIAKLIAFNLEDMSSKYEVKHGHQRVMKQHKQMFTLSGRRSLFHDGHEYITRSTKSNLLHHDIRSENNKIKIDNEESSRSSSSSSSSSSSQIHHAINRPTNLTESRRFNIETKADYWDKEYYNTQSSALGASSHRQYEETPSDVDNIKPASASTPSQVPQLSMLSIESDCNELDAILAQLVLTFDRVKQYTYLLPSFLFSFLSHTLRLYVALIPKP